MVIVPQSAPVMRLFQNMVRLTQPVRLAWQSAFRRLLVRPPALPKEYSQADFYWFMRSEIFHYSSRYALRRVVIHEAERLYAETRKGGAVLAFIHYGSFFLSGGAIVHQLGLPYTAMVSRRNLIPEMMPPEDIPYWHMVHGKAARLYRTSLLFTDEFPIKAIRWLKQGHLLGMALDVREYGQRHKESLFEFMGEKIYMQYGPARVARSADVPLIPMSIRYNQPAQLHHLRFGPPVRVDKDPRQATQTLLDFFSDDSLEEPAQLFHDIIKSFREPCRSSIIV